MKINHFQVDLHVPCALSYYSTRILFLNCQHHVGRAQNGLQTARN